MRNFKTSNMQKIILIFCHTFKVQMKYDHQMYLTASTYDFRKRNVREQEPLVFAAVLQLLQPKGHIPVNWDGCSLT